MKEKLEKNEYLEVYIDRDKNRCYMTLRGYWESQQTVPTFRDIMLKYPKLLKPNFTTLLDMREFRVPAPDVMDMFVEVMKENSKYEYKKSARIVNGPLEKLATQRVGKESQTIEKTVLFNTIEEAEAWLDEDD